MPFNASRRGYIDISNSNFECKINVVMVSVNIIRVANGSQAQLEEFKRLAVAYLDWLSEDLHFQGVDDELSTLPGVYAEDNKGVLLIATLDTPLTDTTKAVAVGTAAIRPLKGKQRQGIDSIDGIDVSEICELKRVFVDVDHQKKGIGKRLVEEAIRIAKGYGYKAMVLDTLKRLEAANRMYYSLGFENCIDYSHCPLDGPLYFILKL